MYLPNCIPYTCSCLPACLPTSPPTYLPIYLTTYLLLPTYLPTNQPTLFLCNRRIDDDMGRTHELEHSAIKCMRGILYCYMRQADKVSRGPELGLVRASHRCGPPAFPFPTIDNGAKVVGAVAPKVRAVTFIKWEESIYRDLRDEEREGGTERSS